MDVTIFPTAPFMLFWQNNSRLNPLFYPCTSCLFLSKIIFIPFQIEIVCVIDLHTKENQDDRKKAFEEVKSACEELGFRRNEEKVFQIQV